jgi:hypothetical protein
MYFIANILTSVLSPIPKKFNPAALPATAGTVTLVGPSLHPPINWPPVDIYTYIQVYTCVYSYRYRDVCLYVYTYMYKQIFIYLYLYIFIFITYWYAHTHVRGLLHTLKKSGKVLPIHILGTVFLPVLIPNIALIGRPSFLSISRSMTACKTENYSINVS